MQFTSVSSLDSAIASRLAFLRNGFAEISDYCSDAEKVYCALQKKMMKRTLRYFATAITAVLICFEERFLSTSPGDRRQERDEPTWFLDGEGDLCRKSVDLDWHKARIFRHACFRWTGALVRCPSLISTRLTYGCGRSRVFVGIEKRRKGSVHRNSSNFSTLKPKTYLFLSDVFSMWDREAEEELLAREVGWPDEDAELAEQEAEWADQEAQLAEREMDEICWGLEHLDLNKNSPLLGKRKRCRPAGFLGRHFHFVDLEEIVWRPLKRKKR